MQGSLLIKGKYMANVKLGAGSFGQVYQGINQETKEHIAIKLEHKESKFKQLLKEAIVYRVLQQEEKESYEVGIPKFYWFGYEGDFAILITEVLGPNLEDLFNLCGRKFSLKTVLMLAVQMIEKVEFMHNKDLIHRDIKPENFLVGRGKRANMLYIVDYGLAKRFYDKKTKQHISFSTNKQIVGTVRYSSVSSHLGRELSRRDDLESLAYIFIYFLKGSLPWQDEKAKTRLEKYDKVLESKTSTPADILCRGLPNEFMVFLTYVQELNFDETPDYNLQKKNFTDLYLKLGFHHDTVYDWNALSVKKPLPFPLKQRATVEIPGCTPEIRNQNPTSKFKNPT